MVKDIALRETALKVLTPKVASRIIYPEPKLPLPTNAFNLMLENLPAITELYKELREGKKIELYHERAMREIELQDSRWIMTIQTRCRERDRLHNSLHAEIEKTDDISHKLALYNQWIESLSRPLALTEEVNLLKGGDE